MGMDKKRFTVSVARKLLYMLEGKTVPSSSLPHWITDELRVEELITGVTRGSRISYRCTDAVACSRYIVDNYTSGTSLERWIEVFSGENKDLQRSTLVQETGDSKTVKLRTFRGFLVNCYEPISARIGEKELLISPSEGTAVFVQTPEEFHIPSDITVVGVENGENFHHIRCQKYLFGDNRILFVSRYPQSADLREWLMKIPNRYIHFGDFDLAGISIYQSEFYKYLGERASFFIPEDIDERLRAGNAGLYNTQYLRYKNMKITDPRLDKLVEMIHRYGKVYEQEGYIKYRYRGIKSHFLPG